MSTNHDGASCPIDLVLQIIESKWTIPLLRELMRGPRRYSELGRLLNGINPKTLTQRLKELEERKLVIRNNFSETPPRVEYALTERGMEIKPLLQSMLKIGCHWEKESDLCPGDGMVSFCSQCQRSQDCPIYRQLGPN